MLHNSQFLFWYTYAGLNHVFKLPVDVVLLMDGNTLCAQHSNFPEPLSCHRMLLYVFV